MLKGIANNYTVIYARHSEGISIEEQIKCCQEYAKENDLKIIKIYAENDDTRAIFQEMIKDSRGVTFNNILVYKSNCFRRNRYDNAIHKLKLKDDNVTVLTTIKDDASEVLMESVLGVMAEYFSLLDSERIKAVIKASKERKLQGGEEKA